MKQKLLDILTAMQRYNSPHMARDFFGLDETVTYDALVVAPGWKPTRILRDPSWNITTLSEHSYISGYLTERNSRKIAWIQCASGACNLIDHLTVCAELSFRKLIFVGAVGSLSTAIPVGMFCTPSYSVAGVFANAYLCDRLTDYTPFEKVTPPDEDYINHVIALAAQNGWELKKASVFCTDSIALEYSRLDEIKSHGTDLIEMETSSFYRLAELFEVPAVALLAVSDNSATGDPLIGRTEEADRNYQFCKNIVIPELIFHLACE